MVGDNAGIVPDTQRPNDVPLFEAEVHCLQVNICYWVWPCSFEELARNGIE